MAFNRATSRLSFRTHQSNLSSIRRQKSRGHVTPSPGMTPDHAAFESVDKLPDEIFANTDVGWDFGPDGIPVMGHIGSGEIENAESNNAVDFGSSIDGMNTHGDTKRLQSRSQSMLYRTQSSLKRAGSKLRTSLSDLRESMKHVNNPRIGLAMGMPNPSGF